LLPESGEARDDARVRDSQTELTGEPSYNWIGGPQLAFGEPVEQRQLRMPVASIGAVV
jgi:hypothetical protein